MTPQEAVEYLIGKGLTKAQIARETKTSPVQIDNYLVGKTYSMSEHKAKRFYNEYGIKIDDERIYPL